jgi:hypothetical protein
MDGCLEMLHWFRFSVQLGGHAYLCTVRMKTMSYPLCDQPYSLE